MVEVFIAQSVGSKKVQELHLVGSKPFPDFDELGTAGNLHMSQGRLIVETLLNSLAGGTVDAVLIHLLDAKRSQLIIPFKILEASGRDSDNKTGG